jgi:short subunit dehydrogenase-like uncharacterized protein
MPRALLIYGASGYTGKLLTRAAADHDLHPILAGRDGAQLRAVAAPLRLRYRVVPVDDARRLSEALRDVHVLLNAAGPFSATARPLVDACLRTQTHYLDLAGELAVFSELERLDEEARDRNLMLMPGAGFLVVASDCLAAHVAARLPGAHRLRIGTSRSLFLSRGSARTMLGLVADAVMVRRNGVLTSVPVGAVEREFDYGQGRRRSTAMSMAELVTAFRTTGIGDIEAYVEVNPVEHAALWLAARMAWLMRNPLCQVALQTQAELLPDGPSDDERGHGGRAVVVEAEDRAGRTLRARLCTPEAYRFTAAAALTIAGRVLRNELQAGFQTPALTYGADFVLGLEGVRREDAAA